MTILYLLEVHSTRMQETTTPSLAQNLDSIAGISKNLPGIQKLNLLVPAEGGHDPFLKDEGPPVLVLQLQTEPVSSLNKILESTGFRHLLDTINDTSTSTVTLVQEAFTLDPYKSCESYEGHADISYLVNYQRPAEDEATFLKYYREHHPAILLDFPGLRRLELGLPIDWTPAIDIERADRMLYCEVSFDSVEALNIALDSEVRAVLRKDYECFPPFSGEVTHFAMHRHTYL